MKKALVLGCGGTGSWFLHNLYKNPEIAEGWEFHLVDPDIVKEWNLLRQWFKRKDLSHLKVVSLAERLAAVGIAVNPIPFPLEEVPFQPDAVFVFIDNILWRRKYYKRFFPSVRHFWLDSGNRAYDGQIFVLPQGEQDPLYRNFLNQPGDKNRSCGDDMPGPFQSLFVNRILGKKAFEVFKEFVSRGYVRKTLYRVGPWGDNGDNRKRILYRRIILLRGFVTPPDWTGYISLIDHPIRLIYERDGTYYLFELFTGKAVTRSWIPLEEVEFKIFKSKGYIFRFYGKWSAFNWTTLWDEIPRNKIQPAKIEEVLREGEEKEGFISFHDDSELVYDWICLRSQYEASNT